LSHMLPQTALQHQSDRSVIATWGPFTLKSAFQPIFRFDEGKLHVAAYEGLARPFRDDGPVPPPAFFRSVPASAGLYVETLTRTLHLMNAATFLDPATLLFVNFNPAVFLDRAVAVSVLQDMRRTLAETHIDPGRIVCEVTEQSATSERMLDIFVSILRDNGFGIAVDDFGVADSDMQRVTALKPDILKFDAQWIARLMDTRPGVALLAVMVEKFTSQGMTVVFEGLEENWQLEIAEEVGANMVQGFVLARPEIVPPSFSTLWAASTPPVAVAEPMDDEPLADTFERRSPAGPAAPRPFGRRAPR
jgi:EAL domain-containing protein (putative c-di-GMP-specific phosphodiesterase class I)